MDKIEIIRINGVDYEIGGSGAVEIHYTQAEVDSYNAELAGALESNVELTAEQALAYNTAIGLSSEDDGYKEANSTLTEEEVNTYNATLTGAISTSDTHAVSIQDYVDDKFEDVLGVNASGIAALKALTEDNDAATGILNELSKCVYKSNTIGLLKNDGSVDTNTYLTQHQDISGKVDSSDLATVATSGVYSDLTGTPTLATVATSGSYNDLIDTPTEYSVMGASGNNHASGLVPDPGATAGTTKFLCEDGTWKMPTGNNDEFLVDLGLPSGLLWAKSNIDLTQANGFAVSPYQYGCSYFSWGNTDGHNPVSDSSFGEWSFGTGNDTEPYASSAGAMLTDGFGDNNDAACVTLGKSWRMPTFTEFNELLANCDIIDAEGNVITTESKVTTVNGIKGLYLQSKKNSNRIFFPCSGVGTGGDLSSRGTVGYYWSSSLPINTQASNFVMYSSAVGTTKTNRFCGMPIRPVQATSKRVDKTYNAIPGKSYYSMTI